MKALIQLARIAFLAIVAASISTCGGDNGGDDGGEVPNHPPSISNLVYSPATAYQVSGATVAINGSVDFTDAGGDVVLLRLVTSGGEDLTVPTPALSGVTAGTATGTFVVSVDKVGASTFEIWMTDRQGNASNRLGGTFEVLPFEPPPVSGSLDATFNGTGIVKTEIWSGAGWRSGSRANALAIQPDGRIVITGYSRVSGSTPIRYESNGAWDTSFNVAAGVETTFSESESYAIALQPDGKIVIVGHAWISDYYEYGLCRRNNADGSPDGKFGCTDQSMIHSTFFLRPTAVAVQADRKIVVTGHYIDGSVTTLLGHEIILRLEADGGHDLSFNGTGFALTRIPGDPYQSYPTSVAIDANGRIVTGGWAHDLSHLMFTVVRHASDGSIDKTFNATGIATQVVGVYDAAWFNDWYWPPGISDVSIALQADGKIIVAGASTDGIRSVFRVIRYNDDGSLDTSFNGTGIVTTEFGTEDGWAAAVAVQTDGKIVVAGVVGTDANGKIAVVRYRADGSLDTSFGASGMVFTEFPGGGAAYDLAIQADGKIVVAGASCDPFMEEDRLCKATIVRYNP